MARRKGAVTFKTRFKNLTFDIEKLRANDMQEIPETSKAKKFNFLVEEYKTKILELEQENENLK